MSADDGLAGIALANATSGPDTNAIAADLIGIVADREPPLPQRWAPPGSGLLARIALS